MNTQPVNSTLFKRQSLEDFNGQSQFTGLKENQSLSIRATSPLKEIVVAVDTGGDLSSTIEYEYKYKDMRSAQTYTTTAEVKLQDLIDNNQATKMKNNTLFVTFIWQDNQMIIPKIGEETQSKHTLLSGNNQFLDIDPPEGISDITLSESNTSFEKGVPPYCSETNPQAELPVKHRKLDEDSRPAEDRDNLQQKARNDGTYSDQIGCDLEDDELSVLSTPKNDNELDVEDLFEKEAAQPTKTEMGNIRSIFTVKQRPSKTDTSNFRVMQRPKKRGNDSEGKCTLSNCCPCGHNHYQRGGPSTQYDDLHQRQHYRPFRSSNVDSEKSPINNFTLSLIPTKKRKSTKKTEPIKPITSQPRRRPLQSIDNRNTPGYTATQTAKPIQEPPAVPHQCTGNCCHHGDNSSALDYY